MKAIYKGKLYSIVDDNGSEVKLQSLDADVDMTIWVSYGFGAPDFIIDPTDDEINNILPDYV